MADATITPIAASTTNTTSIATSDTMTKVIDVAKQIIPLVQNTLTSGNTSTANTASLPTVLSGETKAADAATQTTTENTTTTPTSTTTVSTDAATPTGASNIDIKGILSNIISKAITYVTGLFKGNSANTASNGANGSTESNSSIGLGNILNTITSFLGNLTNTSGASAATASTDAASSQNAISGIVDMASKLFTTT